MTKIIGTIDCETLGRQPRSIVWEVALATFECETAYEPVLGTYKEAVWHVNTVEQAHMGRTSEPETIEFHRRILGDDYTKITTGKYEGAPPVFNCRNLLCAVQSRFAGADEVWINKSSFDHGIMHTLAEDLFMKDELWPHKAEFDLRTGRKMARVHVPGEATHRGLADVKWNVEVLKAIGRAGFGFASDWNSQLLERLRKPHGKNIYVVSSRSNNFCWIRCLEFSEPEDVGAGLMCTRLGQSIWLNEYFVQFFVREPS